MKAPIPTNRANSFYRPLAEGLHRMFARIGVESLRLYDGLESLPDHDAMGRGAALSGKGRLFQAAVRANRLVAYRRLLRKRIAPGKHWGTDRYDHHFCITEISELPVPPEEEAFSPIGINPEDSSLSIEPHPLCALIDFERPHHPLGFAPSRMRSAPLASSAIGSLQRLSELGSDV